MYNSLLFLIKRGVLFALLSHDVVNAKNGRHQDVDTFNKFSKDRIEQKKNVNTNSQVKTDEGRQ